MPTCCAASVYFLVISKKSSTFAVDFKTKKCKIINVSYERFFSSIVAFSNHIFCCSL